MRRLLVIFSFLAILLGAHLHAKASETISAKSAASFTLNATYKVDTVWATAYNAVVTLTNNTSTPTSSWTATFTLPQGQTLSSHLSGGVFTTSGQNVTVTNPAGQGIIQPGASTTFSMIINMPSSSPKEINNLQAVANSSIEPPPPPVSSAPVLDAIVKTGTQSYTLSWSQVSGVTNYILQQDKDCSFSNPTTVTQGNILSYSFSNQAAGTYYYRVLIVNAAGSKLYSNSQSIVISSTPPPPPVPNAPTINTISLSGTQSYTVSWNSVANASAYILQQDTSSSFSNPRIVAQGNVLSKTFSNQPAGTYYYRVIAENASGDSPYSNVQSITITTNNPPPIDAKGVERSVWYIDWTSWFTGPSYVLPAGNDMINIFVGEINFGADGKPTMGGFGTMTPSQMKSFTAYCRSLPTPIAVKVSIGGGGGMYDRCWDRLTSTNISAFAQGMVDFCHANGLAGVDFDYEAFASAEQEALVGRLIKEFKMLDPKLQTSLCSNAGFGPNFPWQQSVKNILDAATIAPGNCAVDRMYIMTYYNSMQDEIGWLVGADGKGGWSNWLIQNYGFTRARISVGIDDFDAHAYDPEAFKAWAISNGFSTAHWAFDPAHPAGPLVGAQL